MAERLLGEGFLSERALAYEEELLSALQTDTWVSRFPGRLVLARFVGSHVGGVNYEGFRNLILDQMVDDAFEPEGMKQLVHAIEEA